VVFDLRMCVLRLKSKQYAPSDYANSPILAGAFRSRTSRTMVERSGALIEATSEPRIPKPVFMEVEMMRNS